MLEGAPNPAQEDCVTVGFVAGDIILQLCSTLPKDLNFKSILTLISLSLKY